MVDQWEREVGVLKRIAVFTIILLIFPVLSPGLSYAAGESHVTGRLTGTQRELPGYFRNNMRLHELGIDQVEFYGFRLLRMEDGKNFLIRPNHDGYFHQDLPGGEYTLTRKRNDRPGYKEPKTIDIMSFEVEPGTLVNLGTLNIVLSGEPSESLFSLAHGTRGKYIYRYHYEREPGDIAFDGPLNWFMGKKPGIGAGFGERIVREGAAVTVEGDGSKVVLEEIERWPDR
jgi:hypothetical protein